MPRSELIYLLIGSALLIGVLLRQQLGAHPRPQLGDPTPRRSNTSVILIIIAVVATALIRLLLNR